MINLRKLIFLTVYDEYIIKGFLSSLLSVRSPSINYCYFNNGLCKDLKLS